MSPGDLVTLNGFYDLAFDGAIKPYIGQLVTVVKLTKSGLYQIRAADGSLHSVPKRNLTVEASRDPS